VDYLELDVTQKILFPLLFIKQVLAISEQSMVHNYKHGQTTNLHIGNVYVTYCRYKSCANIEW